MRDDTNYTFYEDQTTPGGVIALSHAERSDGLREGFVSTYDRKNSPVTWNAVPEDALGKELTEEEARSRHPRLFEKIDG